jgi:putative acetyltransferase
MMIDAPDRLDLRRAEASDAEACGDILNAWIDARDWMPRVHAPEDVRAFYRDFVLPHREVWVTGDPVEAFLAMDAEGTTVTGALRGAAGARDRQGAAGSCEGGAGPAVALDVSGQ